jgi:hypothetical protein
MKRIILGGLAGGVLLFFWGFFSHTVLPLGEMGIKSLPEEEVVVGTLESALSEPAIYFFPGMSDDPSEEEMLVWQQRYEAGPLGILFYRPTGFTPFVGQLPYQLLTDLAAVLLAAFFLSMLTVSYWKRVLFVTSLGLLCWFTIVVPYWIWYLFPSGFILGSLVDLVAGWFLVGLLLGAIVKPAE